MGIINNSNEFGIFLLGMFVGIFIMLINIYTEDQKK